MKNRRLIDYREGELFQLKKDGQNTQKSMCIQFRMYMVCMNLQIAEARLFTLVKVNYKTGQWRISLMVLILYLELHFLDLQVQVVRKRLFKTRILHYQTFLDQPEFYQDLTKREEDNTKLYSVNQA